MALTERGLNNKLKHVKGREKRDAVRSQHYLAQRNLDNGYRGSMGGSLRHGERVYYRNRAVDKIRDDSEKRENNFTLESLGLGSMAVGALVMIYGLVRGRIDLNAAPQTFYGDIGTIIGGCALIILGGTSIGFSDPAIRRKNKKSKKRARATLGNL